MTSRRPRQRQGGRAVLAFLMLLFVALQTGLFCMPPRAIMAAGTGGMDDLHAAHQRQAAPHHHAVPTPPMPPGDCCPAMHAPPATPAAALPEVAPELPLLPAPLSAGLLPTPRAVTLFTPLLATHAPPPRDRAVPLRI